jgi:hypothetical protein
VVDKQEGVRDIESTLRSAQKSGENMDPVIRQEYMAITPADRQAALAQIKKDRVADPSLPGLEITDRGGDVSVKSDTTRSWATWAKETLNNAETAVRQDVATGQNYFDQFKQATLGAANDERLKVPGEK